MLLQVGDFIAVANLTVKACQALSSTRGSKAQCTSLVETLKAVGKAMIQAEAVFMEYHTSSFSDTCQNQGRMKLLDSIAEGITKECSQCRSLVSSFLERFQSYSKVFDKPDSGLMTRGNQAYKSMAFQFRKEEIASMEERLHEHLQALQLHLNSFY
jgi:hypothetical protein